MDKDLELDDENKAVFFIPFTGGGSKDGSNPLPQSFHQERCLIGNEHLHNEAYTETWKKCQDRVISVIAELHAQVVKDIVNAIQDAYGDVFRGLPYSELPVICIQDPFCSLTFIDEITTRLETADLRESALFGPVSLVAHLYPTDCISVLSVLKFIIAEFTERKQILERVKGRPSTSLAVYDMETLCAWYAEVRTTFEITDECQPTIAIIMHDFEKLDPLIIQDLLSISSLYVRRLPLVFVLLCTSPSSPSCLHLVYPHSTLALLRVKTIVAPCGAQVLEKILLKTFFDVEFLPDVMIGSNILLYLIDSFTRHNASLDSILTILHLTHLKHFSIEPSTILVKRTPPSHILKGPTCNSFVQALAARLQLQSPSCTDPRSSQRLISKLIDSVDDARTSFHYRAARMRLGFGMMRSIQQFLVGEGYRGLGWNKPGGVTLFKVMVDILCNNMGPYIESLRLILRKLRQRQVQDLLVILDSYFDSMPDQFVFGKEARGKLKSFLDSLSNHQDGEVWEDKRNSFVNWLAVHLRTLFTPLESATLWDIWYTGRTSFPSELINPSLRASVVSGLLFPHRFAVSNEKEGNYSDDRYLLWEYPDTSILFRRYLDSGKMINVYDWFESYQVVIENQRQNIEKSELVKTPKKRVSRSKSPKKRGKETSDASRVERGGEFIEKWNGAPEEWKLQIQSRFVRGIHELDYLGFIKHTGRKADHVLRTTFDVLE